MNEIISLLTLLVLFTLFVVWKMFVIIPMREAGIKERLGKFVGVLNPGFHFLIPFIDRVAYRTENREQVIDIPPQRCITRDNVELDVDGVVFLKVIDPQKAVYGIGNYRSAAINLAQTTMRSEIGKLDLDDTFREREAINNKIVHEIDKASASWGIKFIRYEIRNIEPSAQMLETMEKQMEAERQKRANITMAQGNKEYRTNVSEGERQEAINLSLGEKQKRINEAEGKAAEISLIADATAHGIRRIAEAIRRPGGIMAMKVRLIEHFIDEFGKILATSTITIVPENLANLRGFFEGINSVSTTMGRGGKIDRTGEPNEGI